MTAGAGQTEAAGPQGDDLGVGDVGVESLQTVGPETPAATDPVRLVILPVLHGPDGARCILVRSPDWPHPVLLSLAPPSAHDSLEAAVGDLLRARLHLRLTAAPLVAPERLPARMAQPRAGRSSPGWLIPVLAAVEGEPEHDALLDGVETLTLEEALEALSTSIERAALRAAWALRDLEGDVAGDVARNDESDLGLNGESDAERDDGGPGDS